MARSRKIASARTGPTAYVRYEIKNGRTDGSSMEHVDGPACFIYRPVLSLEFDPDEEVTPHPQVLGNDSTDIRDCAENHASAEKSQGGPYRDTNE